MPVWLRIQASVVSSPRSRSAFVTTVSGMATPHPAMPTGMRNRPRDAVPASGGVFGPAMVGTAVLVTICPSSHSAGQGQLFEDVAHLGERRLGGDLGGGGGGPCAMNRVVDDGGELLPN